MIPAERDYIAAYKRHSPKLVPNYQVKWNSILQEETLGEILPSLAQGKMTPEEFTAREDESIWRFSGGAVTAFRCGNVGSRWKKEEISGVLRRVFFLIIMVLYLLTDCWKALI